MVSDIMDPWIQESMWELHLAKGQVLMEYQEMQEARKKQ